VDVVAYHDPDFQEPSWLLVPANSEDVLPTDIVVALYRERMQVEQSFRDSRPTWAFGGCAWRFR
jgi:hypothetical protein